MAADPQTVIYDSVPYRIVREGKAEILAPAGARIESATDEAEVQKVFYNPIQQFNRDLTVLAITAFGEEYLEAKRARARVQKQNRKRKREGEDGGAKGDKVARVEEGKDVEMVTEGASTFEPAPAPTSEPTATPTTTTTTTTPTIPFTILDALSATGLRALRYAHEIPFVTSVTANDLSPTAVAAIRLHATHNNLTHKITPTNEDALAHMYRTIAADLGAKRDYHPGGGMPSEAQRYTVIDLDPYGTAAPFLDAAVQCTKDGGLLAVTCTDSALFAGHGYSEKTFSLYGGVPVRGLFSHEAGLRLIINAVAQAAARHGTTVEPLLSLSIDYYCRIFLRVRRSQAATKFLASKTMLLYNCDHGCGSWQTQYLLKAKLQPTKRGDAHYYKHSMMQGPSSDSSCRHCGGLMHMSGPMYGGYLHCPDFVRRLLALLPTADASVYGTLPRIEGMLTTALEEISIPPSKAVAVQRAHQVPPFFAAIDPQPFFVVPSKLAASVACESPSSDFFRGALRRLGYSATRSHCRAGSIKTDAPWEDIWWIMREWVRQRAPVKIKNIAEHHPAHRILKGLFSKDNDSKKEDVDNTENAKDTDAMDTDTKDTAKNTKQDAEKAMDTEDTKDTEKDAEIAVTAIPPLPEIESMTLEQRKCTLIFNAALEREGRDGPDPGAGARLLRYQQNPRPNWGPMTKAVPR